MLALENEYRLDFTGEGGIGDSVKAVLWQPGAVEEGMPFMPLGAYELSSGAVAIDLSGLGVADPTVMNITLSSRGKLWSVPRSTEVIGVIQEEGTYKLLMVQGEGARASYTIESFDFTGESSGRAEKSSLSEVLALENEYRLDFTGEGGIGDSVKTVLWQPDFEQRIDFGIFELATGAVAIDFKFLEPGDNTELSLILKSRGNLWSLPRSTEVIGVLPPEEEFRFEAIFGESRFYRVVMVTGEGPRAAYTIESFGLDGESLGTAARSSLSEVLALESQYGLDMDGDNLIGEREILRFQIAETEILITGAVDLVTKDNYFMEI